MFYSSPVNLLLPGRARHMGEGWENARRRDGGNDHVTVRLGAAGHVRLVELDTSYFLGNAPGWARLRGIDARTGDLADEGAWFDLVPRTRLQPDTRHRFRTDPARAVTHVRLDVYPDGGLARLRVHGELAPGAREELVLRWLNLLPGGHARAVLQGEAGLSGEDAAALVARRPFPGLDALPEPVRAALLGRPRPGSRTSPARDRFTGPVGQRARPAPRHARRARTSRHAPVRRTRPRQSRRRRAGTAGPYRCQAGEAAGPGAGGAARSAAVGSASIAPGRETVTAAARQPRAAASASGSPASSPATRPAQKLSPAAVASTARTGTAGTRATPSAVTTMAPSAPRVTTTARGPPGSRLRARSATSSGLSGVGAWQRTASSCRLGTSTSTRESSSRGSGRAGAGLSTTVPVARRTASATAGI